MMQMDKIRTRMNDLGRKGPFLFVIDFEFQKPLLMPLSEARKNGILYNFKGQKNYSEERLVMDSTQLIKRPISFKMYKRSFDHVMTNLHYGNSFLVNLTMPTRIETSLTLEEVFFSNRQAFRFLLKDEFVVFSPESFVSIDQNTIRSFPMKGTIDAAIDNAVHTLLNDKKEQAEHATIVDLIRNDLSMVASEVKVENYRYVECINTNDRDLLQVSTEISGKVPSDWRDRVGDMICPLLPAGSISGAPKPQTRQIINEAETSQRGYYTGVMGIFDGESLSSAVMIRYIEQNGEHLTYRSGGGITSMSSARSEYQEMLDKVYLPK